MGKKKAATAPQKQNKGTILGGPRKLGKPLQNRSITTTEEEDDENRGSFSSTGLCLQCDLLTHAVEEAIKTFSSNSQNNLHLVMKEIHHMCVEIGRCCGRPEYSSDYHDDESESTSLSSPRRQIFWEQLREQIENNGGLRLRQEKKHAKPKDRPPFHPPARPPAPAAASPTLKNIPQPPVLPPEEIKDEAGEKE
jgi:hypothetical protein